MSSSPRSTRRLAAGGKYKIDWTKAWGGTLVKLGSESKGVADGIADIGLISTIFEGAQVPAAEHQLLHAVRQRRHQARERVDQRPAAAHSGDGRCLDQERPGLPGRYGARQLPHGDQVPDQERGRLEGQEDQRRRAIGELDQGHGRGAGGEQPQHRLRRHQVGCVGRLRHVPHRHVQRQALRGGALHHQGELRLAVLRRHRLQQKPLREAAARGAAGDARRGHRMVGAVRHAADRGGRRGTEEDGRRRRQGERISGGRAQEVGGHAGPGGPRPGARRSRPRACPPTRCSTPISPISRRVGPSCRATGASRWPGAMASAP